MIKKQKGEFVTICDVCNEPGPSAETFKDAVYAKSRAGWESKRYRRGDGWYDVSRACLKEQADLRQQGKKNLFDIL